MHPILFHVGSGAHSFAVHTYGVMLMLAFLAGIGRACWRVRKAPEATAPITVDHVLDAGMWAVVAGVAGARLMFVAIDWSDYRTNPASVLALWQGGMSFHGGLIGGIVADVIYCRVKKIPVLRLADLFGPSLMLGYAIGRIGCFFNGCCYGAPTTMPWGVRFWDNGVLTPPSHPTQLYSSFMSFIFFAALVRLEKAGGFFPGRIGCWYLILAATERFVMEIWRAGVTSSGIFWGLTEVQWLCLGMMGVGVAGLYTLRRAAGRNRIAANEVKAAG